MARPRIVDLAWKYFLPGAEPEGKRSKKLNEH
jgi:hypothetical protein